MAAMASLIDCEPPSATTQPKRCADPASINPTDAVIGALSGRMTCAATPAHRARPCVVRKRRASIVAGASAASPKRARTTGCLGTWTTGTSTSSSRSSKRAVNGPNSRSHAGPSAPSRVDGGGQVADHHPRAPVVEGVGQVHLRLAPPQPVALEVDTAEER